MLIDAGWQGDRRLRMFVGGEALSPELAQDLLARGSELWNLYGPTETTVWSTLEKIERDAKRIVVGRPIDHTQVYILDADRQLVPEGVIGEIYIGGAGVARGYRGRPDLTEQRFVADPYGAPGGRMYRTGDLGRWLDDGRIECLGRLDHQVKVRGFRIELGEIESALRGVPDVQDCVVVAGASGATDAKLIAYWVGCAERAALLACAREKLPHYMVPAAYVRLDAFPLTTSGKVDRKALPAPEGRDAQDAELRLPGSDVERRLAALWSDVLAIAPIGVDQDFFAIGGTSILATVLRARIEKEFATELALRVFFEAPTIEGIARALERGAAAEPAHASCLVRLKPGSGERCLFLIHDGDGEVLLYRNLALEMPSDVSVYGVVPLAGRGVPMVHTRVDAMAEHYLREIRARQPQGPYYLSGLCAGGVIAFEVARRLRLANQAVGVLMLIDAAAPQARYVPMRVARERWRRIWELIGNLGTYSVHDIASETRRRFGNTARYELDARIDKLRARTLLWLFDALLADPERSWPEHLLPAPSVREIYLHALAHHWAQPVSGVPTILARATEGIGNNPPLRDELCDPDFGWREVLGDAITVLDSPGSHSTMLQQGRVEAIAKHVQAAFESERARTAAPGGQQSPGTGPAASANGSDRSKTPAGARVTVTTVTVSYKTAAIVTRLLASIAAERERTQGRLDIRSIVVDNASGDAPALREAIAKNGWQDWATLIEAERNGGFAYGNNVAFAHAYATSAVPDFFYLLNPDTEIRRPDAIPKLVEFMQRTPDCGIAGSSLEAEDGDLFPYAFRFPSLLSEVENALGIGLVTQLLESKVVPKRMTDRPEAVDWIPGASFMVRRAVIDRLGGMDESYFLYYEETDFCRKVKAAGWSVWYVPESRVMHDAGQSTGVTTAREKARRLPDYWFESRRRYFAKNHGLRYAIATDLATFVAYALGRSKLALQGRGQSAPPRYLFDLARHSPLLAKNRDLSPAREFRRDAPRSAKPAKAAAGS
jgi:GT2 family glycosyltransferase/thioesterase domain-containing protein